MIEVRLGKKFLSVVWLYVEDLRRLGASRLMNPKVYVKVHALL